MNLQLVYRCNLSLSKYENMKKKLNKTKTKRPTSKNKKIPPAGVEPQTINVRSQPIIYCATTTKVKHKKMLNQLSLTFLPISAGRRCLKLVELYL